MKPWKKPTRTSIPLILEVIGLAGLIKIVVLIATEYTALPDQIPIHYSFTGEADGFGSKGLIWILPGLSILLYALLTLLARHPHMLRYPVPLTPVNRDRQFGNVTMLLRYVKLFVVGLMVYLASETIAQAGETAPRVSLVFLPVSLIILLLILGVFVYRSHKFR